MKKQSRSKFKVKKVRKSCSNCGQYMFLRPDCEDQGRHFLCDECDKVAYAWRVKVDGFWTDDFLRSNMARVCARQQRAARLAAGKKY